MPYAPSEPVLAADIGGTRARFRIARGDRPAEPICDRVLRVADFPTFGDALAAFLAEAGLHAPRRAAFAVAGPVEGDRATLTNATWTIDAAATASRFGLARARLVNDFEAAAAGVAHLPPGSLRSLQAGERLPEAPRLVIGAGTGLGVAFAVPLHGELRILGGEGGHVPFAPQDPDQQALHRFLAPELGRVIAEHVVSGPGLVRLYRYARWRDDGAEPAAAELAEGAATVAERARSGEAAARHAIALFCTIFGAVAGDHALTLMTRGGVFVAGGIAPRLVEALADGRFVASFRCKGVHSPLMAKLPVDVVLDERLGLIGAAALAAAQQD